MPAAAAPSINTLQPHRFSFTPSHAPGAYGWDRKVFLDINHFQRHTKWLHFPLHEYAQLGVWLLAVLLVVGWWLARRGGPAKVAAALWAGAGGLLALAVSEPIGDAVAEPRPWEVMPHIRILVGHTLDHSFPSGDAVVAGAVTVGLLLYHRRLGIIAAAAGLLDCFGWVYIGDHYPQDVIGGLGLGALVALLGNAIVRAPLTAAVQALSGTRLHPLLAAKAPTPAPPPRPQQVSQPSPAMHDLRTVPAQWQALLLDEAPRDLSSLPGEWKASSPSQTPPGLRTPPAPRQAPARKRAPRAVPGQWEVPLPSQGPRDLSSLPVQWQAPLPSQAPHAPDAPPTPWQAPLPSPAPHAPDAPPAQWEAPLPTQTPHDLDTLPAQWQAPLPSQTPHDPQTPAAWQAPAPDQAPHDLSTPTPPPPGSPEPRTPAAPAPRTNPLPEWASFDPSSNWLLPRANHP
ncbi:MAG TPA: phosphatase PAP2 family protein [Streptosporangiaceae bacterium]|nr:phosphatase PAP2 family protein [Streptosporangiaceae bacterium]